MVHDVADGLTVGGDQPVARETAGGVVARPWAGDDWALVIGSGSDLVELYEQAAMLPAGLAFSEVFGDVDLVLVYRPAQQAPTGRDLLGVLVDQVVERGGILVGEVGPGGLAGVERFMTLAEQTAFAAGQADALAAMRRALTGALDVGAVPVVS